MTTARRAVRRGLVSAIAIGCAMLILSPYGPDDVGGAPFLLLVLALGFVLLGRATQRVASAPDAQVDERQEALRNRAHRLAYGIFAVLVGGTVLVSYVATPESRAWLTSPLHSGLAITFFLLLFFLPAMVLAWLEPDRLAGEDIPSLSATPLARVATAMVAIALLTPIVLSLTLLLGPIRTTTRVVPQPTQDPALHCTYFEARAQVGLGFGAALPLIAVACWDGKKAAEEWGLNASDCTPRMTEMTSVEELECARTTDADGTLHFVYKARVRSALLPFITRDAVMVLVLTRDGRVVRFP